MRKDTLIKLLSEIEGNPEIVFWNGFVQDYQHVSSKLVEDTLVRQTLIQFQNRVRTEKRIQLKNWDIELSDDELDKVKIDYKNIKWELGNFVPQNEIDSGWYKTKKVVFLSPTIRGETYMDRVGSIEY